MKSLHETRDEARRVFRSLLSELRGVQFTDHVPRGFARHTFEIDLKIGGKKTRLFVEVETRLTPQTVLSACGHFLANAKGGVPIFYAPAISPRVAEVLRKEGIGYADSAGNCWIWVPEIPLLIERQGLQRHPRHTPGAVDLFAPRSSRIVRALLHQPMKGWQVTELANHPEVKVSPALVTKVKRSLIEEGYAIAHDRLLYARDPEGLLKAWAANYAGPAEQLHFYVRGDKKAAEAMVRDWCKSQKLRYALSGFSAAWEQGPEVRHNLATAYIEDRGLESDELSKFMSTNGARRVNSGQNLSLWRGYDSSVFAFGVKGPPQSMTSPVQTYLDLIRLAGRGEEAAQSIFRVFMDHIFKAAATQAKEWTNVGT